MPYAFCLSPRGSTSFPKSLFCLAGSLPWDRAPTSTPSQQPAWASSPLSLKYSKFCSGVFPPAPLHQLDPTGSTALPPMWEEEDGEAAALPRSGASEPRISPDWNCSRSVKLPGGNIKYSSLCKTQNCLKGVWVWWGVLGQARGGGWVRLWLG